MKPPTDKQKEFAREIGRVLGISLPEPQTRQSLFLFIRAHKPAFEAVSDYGHEDDGRADENGSLEEMICMGLDPYTGGCAD